MSNADKLNLDRLPWIFDNVLIWAAHSGLQLAVLIWVLTLGAGEFSRLLEDVFTDYASYIRPRFWGYFYGDWPLSATGFVAMWQLSHFEGSDRFYVQPWWYAAMLALGFLISVGLEVTAVLGNRSNPDAGYTWQQELTLSKLAHTIGFALVFGLLASLAPMTFVAGTWEQRCIAIGLVVLCVGAWAFFNALDMKFRSMVYLLVEAHPHPSRYAQKAWPWR